MSFFPSLIPCYQPGEFIRTASLREISQKPKARAALSAQWEVSPVRTKTCGAAHTWFSFSVLPGEFLSIWITGRAVKEARSTSGISLVMPYITYSWIHHLKVRGPSQTHVNKTFKSYHRELHIHIHTPLQHQLIIYDFYSGFRLP